MKNKKPKVLFVTGLFSPFQVEFANEVNKLGLFEYYVAFTIPYSPIRGKHWIINIKNEYTKYIFVAEKNIFPKTQAFWATQVICKINPKVLISAFYKGPLYKQIIKIAKSMKHKIGFWCESPNLLYPKLILKIYENLILKENFKNAKFILAIGDRALRTYKKIFRGDVYLMPYSQDLSLHFSIPRTPKSYSDKITFLFSGQLVKRHNIQLIAKALVKLYRRYSDKFRFVIAGYGPEEYNFLKIINQEPNLKKQIIYDREYETWEDRIRPFSYSDVLVYPSKHSGWGLVVPEAMASGMVVISTPMVEAARYYIKNGINGILIKPDLENLYSQMEWCINNKVKLFEIGQLARKYVYKGTAEDVAKWFCQVIQRYL